MRRMSQKIVVPGKYCRKLSQAPVPTRNDTISPLERHAFALNENGGIGRSLWRERSLERFMEPVPHIAVVDDHRDIRDLVGKYLAQHGFRISVAENAGALRRLLERGAPDLIILDVMMPGEDGLSVCRQLRGATDIPIIFLTAMTEETDRIIGLELGADDYLTKPFNPRELLARIKAVLRRVNSLPPRRSRLKAKTVRFDRWLLNIGRRELVGPDSVAIPLSTAEFRLLTAFIDHAGLVLSRDQLLDLTVGKAADSFDRSIDNQVSRLRKKIEHDPRTPMLIKTHWGGGYSFTAEVEQI